MKKVGLDRLSQNGGIRCHWRGLWLASVFLWRSSGIRTGEPKPSPVAPRGIHNCEVDGLLGVERHRGEGGGRFPVAGSQLVANRPNLDLLATIDEHEIGRE